ncbi:ribonuclease PH [Corynebacterium xerosis]|uniref:Ribonuclease PH n=1 Tax=Corynebacterium xerosis TaxID=1725 RepID=A0A2N6SVW4_9CORY|nr:ribonuclease PH [Corynebacterium xerosis]PMC61199.1 ribonuclease PH [Corynebacterium xerosis]
MTSDFTRADGRAGDEMRKVSITRGFTDNPAGSVLVCFGNTRVMCTASVEQSVPRFKRDSGEGWLTAEYSMLPAATHDRMPRESMRGKVKGRTHEISRLVGRALRAAVDLGQLGENTINIDCDVLQADGGTRTAAITGAYVALADALTYLHAAVAVPGAPLKSPVAAVSVGVIDGKVCLDLPYEEDSRADVDLNVVMTAEGKYVEIQGTGEAATFGRDQLDAMLDVAGKGLRELIELQQEVLRAPYPGELPDGRVRA